MNLVDSIKKRLHHDIVADPFLHARVLNLYLSGEAYPHTVDDYFPIDHVDCAELAQMMRTHLQQEDKHVALYTKAIHKLGSEVVDLPNNCIFNHVIRSHTPEPWRVEAWMKRDARADRVANFMAHAHFLEKRIARSLELHHEACAQATTSNFTGKAVAAVLADEIRHVSYTREAVLDLVPRQRAIDILRDHHASERRANLDFSAAQLRRLIGEAGTHWPRSRKPLYATCAFVMKGVLACA
jgi:hypothetical protein